MPLAKYRAKRRFGVTPEPRGRRPGAKGHAYVIQKHDASRLHYDFRLEMDGVLKSWAVPKGPSLDPSEKRLAVEVEDHPLEYGGFEGRIPHGEYGAGQVIVWDRGTWEPLEDAREGYRRGRLKFELHGEKLRGTWMLVRMGGRAARERRPNWLLIKERDDEARRKGDADILDERPESAATGQRLDRDSANGGGRRSAKASGGTGPRGVRRGAIPPPAVSSAGATSTRTRRGRPRRASVSPARVEGARRAPPPRAPAPQLATLVQEPPEGDSWLHEIKFDGYRMLARLDGGRVRMLSRNGKDWTERFGSLAETIAELPHRTAILDGEVVVLQPNGTTSFQALQNALGDGGADFVFYVFDLLHLDGYDLTAVRLEERKRLLEGVVGALPEDSPVRYSAHVAGRGAAFLREACRRHLEGIISKRRDAPYRATRSRDWLKVKCGRRQEFVIGGYTEPEGSRHGLGALLVGVHDERGALRYAGRVGTGFDRATLTDLERRLARLERKHSPFVDSPRGGKTHWVMPRLVAEVAFTEWTHDDRLRHPSFQGLREDKPALSVKRETPAAPAASDGTSAARRATPNIIAGVTISNGARILYPDAKLTKAEVARYYETVAPAMLPEIVDRPLMLKRCPGGQAGPCFFQKHPGETLPSPPLIPVKIREKSGTETYMTVSDTAGLVTLVQFGVLEMHVWGCRSSRLEQPDRMVFDLDPGPRVEWRRVVALARRMRERLEEIELESFLKTTGGKGLHLVVPLAPAAAWDEVLEFSTALARGMVDEDPAHHTLRMTKAGREDKILVDTMRNGRGATWVAAYSTRARPGAPVSMPIDWDELTPSLRPDAFTVSNAPKRLARRKDPWGGIGRVRQKLTRSMWKAVGGRD